MTRTKFFVAVLLGVAILLLSAPIVQACGGGNPCPDPTCDPKCGDDCPTCTPACGDDCPTCTPACGDDCPTCTPACGDDCPTCTPACDDCPTP